MVVLKNTEQKGNFFTEARKQKTKTKNEKKNETTHNTLSIYYWGR